MISVTYNVFNMSGVLVHSFQKWYHDSKTSCEERVRELIVAEGWMTIGDVAMVEVLERESHQSEPCRKWFNAEMRGATERIKFYHVDEIGVKTQVDFKYVLGRHKNATLYFSTEGMSEIGVVFYDSSSVEAFFSKFDTFRFHGHDYIKVIEPECGELLLNKIMG
jgi:hypothetical protein